VADPLTLIGIEVPRAPQVAARGVIHSYGEWMAGRHSLLGRWVAMALQLTEAANIRLITGEPDQAVFDFVERFGLVDAVLSDWVAGLSERAKQADERDAVVLMRGMGAVASPNVIRRAIEALRATSAIGVVEPALRPRQQALTEMTVVGAGGMQLPWKAMLGTPDTAAMGLAVPVFEVRRLRTYRRDFGLAGGAPQSSGFVWVDEDEVAIADDALGLARAEWLGERHPM